MMLFHLMVYSCVVANDLSGDLISKTCRWDDRGFYANERRCHSDGDVEVGKPIFGFIYEQRLVEKYRCLPVTVKE